ncbi:hypothetical protein SNE40_015110 [Patella caerulea]|uniref:CUB domain-containing protein n=1 Tax=Patella caerulea TaxID=87958 RepID=A0AAN8JGC6_PATCE
MQILPFVLFSLIACRFMAVYPAATTEPQSYDQLAICRKNKGTFYNIGHLIIAQEDHVPECKCRVKHTLQSTGNYLVVNGSAEGLRCSSAVVSFGYGSDVNIPQAFKINWICSESREFYSEFSIMKDEYLDIYFSYTFHLSEQPTFDIKLITPEPIDVSCEPFICRSFGGCDVEKSLQNQDLQNQDFWSRHKIEVIAVGLGLAATIVIISVFTWRRRKMSRHAAQPMVPASQPKPRLGMPSITLSNNCYTNTVSVAENSTEDANRFYDTIPHTYMQCIG